jgi:sugar/nucleoside kinase (ribokinase family)
MQRKKFQVIALGDLVADLITPIQRLPLQAQEHQLARDIMIEAGGSGNFLILAARLGMAVRAFGAVGSDIYGAEVLRLLAGEGVDISAVAVPAGGRTTTVLVLIDDQAQHVFVGMYGAGQTLSFQPEWRGLIEQADALFTSGYAFHPTSAFSPATLLDCLNIAAVNNIPIFFDLGPEVSLADRAQVDAAIAQSTVFLATHEEALNWTGADDLTEAAGHLLGQGPELVIIKLGGQGCVMVTPAGQIHLTAFPVPVVDTAGAGDAFAAAAVYGYLQGFSPEQIGALANAAGAATAARLGTGTCLPQKDELVELLRRHGHSLL